MKTDYIKYIAPFIFILIFTLEGIVSFCPTITVKLSKIADIEILIHPEANGSEKNGEEENETKVKELFLKNSINYNFENTHYTVAEKSIADNNLARKQDVVLSVIIPPPKIV